MVVGVGVGVATAAREEGQCQQQKNKQGGQQTNDAWSTTYSTVILGACCKVTLCLFLHTTPLLATATRQAPTRTALPTPSSHITLGYLD